jgi:hypothetical protein
MDCKFSGTTDEIGFIIVHVHVDINSYSSKLIACIELFNSGTKLEGLELIVSTMEKIK